MSNFLKNWAHQKWHKETEVSLYLLFKNKCYQNSSQKGFTLTSEGFTGKFCLT